MKRPLLVVAVLLAGCVETTPTAVKPYQPSQSEVMRAESAVGDLLKDPGSMQVRRVAGYRVSNGDTIICGEFNSKNGFGAYTGFSAFYVRFLSNGTIRRVVDEADTAYAAYGCRQAASGVIDLAVSE